MTLLLKKRLFSSPRAFAATVAKYLETITSRVGRAARAPVAADVVPEWMEGFFDDVAAFDDEELAEAENDAAARSGRIQAELADTTEQEIAILRRLEEWAAGYEANPDAKAAELITYLKAVCMPDGVHWTNERVVVFTEYRDTQIWLKELLAQEGLGGDGVALLYGGMDAWHREQLRLAFQEPPEDNPVRILLATDAASEGIDLHEHCHRLVNYDIPFNPNKLEQRIGRIDRYGQPDVPEVRHFVGAGWEQATSFEDDLDFLARIAAKVARMEEDLGSVNAAHRRSHRPRRPSAPRRTSAPSPAAGPGSPPPGYRPAPGQGPRGAGQRRQPCPPDQDCPRHWRASWRIADPTTAISDHGYLLIPTNLRFPVRWFTALFTESGQTSHQSRMVEFCKCCLVPFPRTLGGGMIAAQRALTKRRYLGEFRGRRREITQPVLRDSMAFPHVQRARIGRSKHPGLNLRELAPGILAFAIAASGVEALRMSDPHPHSVRAVGALQGGTPGHHIGYLSLGLLEPLQPEQSGNVAFMRVERDGMVTAIQLLTDQRHCAPLPFRVREAPQGEQRRGVPSHGQLDEVLISVGRRSPRPLDQLGELRLRQLALTVPMQGHGIRHARVKRARIIGPVPASVMRHYPPAEPHGLIKWTLLYSIRKPFGE